VWNTGATANFIEGLAAGEYTVSIADSLENDTLVHITINEDPCDITPMILFTPNGDGINDSWLIYNIEHYPDNLILVYNRWGQKVFEHSGSYEPWEGKDLLGIPAPDNSYFYIIYKDKTDEHSILKGSVSILR
jgi:gliding motility-associated-like protein